MFARIHQCTHMGLVLSVLGLVLSVLEVIGAIFKNKCRPIQIVIFSSFEFWQIVFQEIDPYHLGYQICGHRFIQSFPLSSF